MSMSIVTVTPEIAAALLATSEGNRPLSKVVLQRLMRDIRAGKFLYNGETVKLDTNNNLIDGHHRLTAVVETGLPIRTVVVRGVDRAAKSTVDTGKARSFSDVLIMGDSSYKVTEAQLISTTTDWYMRYCTGTMGYTSAVQSNGEREEFLAEHPEILNAVDYVLARKVRTTKRIPKALHPFLLLVAREAGYEEEGREFVDRLIAGTHLDMSSPVLYLREKLASYSTSKVRKRKDYPFAVSVKALAQFCKGEQGRRLSQGEKDSFPRLAHKDNVMEIALSLA